MDWTNPFIFLALLAAGLLLGVLLIAIGFGLYLLNQNRNERDLEKHKERKGNWTK